MAGFHKLFEVLFCALSVTACGGSDEGAGEYVESAEAPFTQSIIIDGDAQSTDRINVRVSLLANDDTAVTEYYLSESPLTPSLSASGWVAVSPEAYLNTYTEYSLAYEPSLGNTSKSVYFWVRDAEGNISNAAHDSINLNVSELDAPDITFVSINNADLTTASPNVTLYLRAFDNIAVTHYLLSENPSQPVLDADSWVSISSPTSVYSADIPYYFSAEEGLKTIYVWFKDALGNLSSPAVDDIKFSKPKPVVDVDVDIGDYWMFFGDSETVGRAFEESVKSQVDAFKNIWEKTFYLPQSVYVNGSGGRKLQETQAHYLSITDRSEASFVHFQESGSQDDTQDTPEKFVNVFESMVRDIVSDSPSAVISTETAYSFELESTTNRYWVQHNLLMREKIDELRDEGIIVYLAEVDRNIKALVEQKRNELGPEAGQQSVWGDVDNSIGRHYTGLGNFMLALSLYSALGYDVSMLDAAEIPSTDVSPEDKQLCVDIINSF